jgi:hypothetical protein
MMNKDEFVALFKQQPYEVQEACVMAFEMPEPQILTFRAFSAQTGMSAFQPTIVGASYHATIAEVNSAVAQGLNLLPMYSQESKGVNDERE